MYRYIYGSNDKFKGRLLTGFVWGVKKQNTVQSKDLADALNISRPSVSRMMAKLKKTGYIEMERYGSIKLTNKGERCAKGIEKRRNVLNIFLADIIGLDKKSVNEEACRIEHAISLKTAEKLDELIDILSQCVKEKQSNSYNKKNIIKEV